MTIRQSRLWSALFLASLMAVSCSSGLREAAGIPPEGWTTFQANGLRINHPHGWQASADASGTVIVIGPEGRSLAVRPFFTTGKLDGSNSGAALTSLATAILPGAVWATPEAIGNNAARMRGTAGTGEGLALLAWATSDLGSAGLASVSTAADMRESSEDFARMLSSLRIAGAPFEGSAGGGDVPYEMWTDPTEGAFSLEVPSGWTAQGETIRLCPGFPEIGIEVTSPDGALYAKVGNDYHWYTLPIPSMGLGPGTTYSMPACTYQSPVANYAPGAAFITDVLLPEARPGAQVTDVRNRPDLASSLSAVGFYPYDAGEVDYIYTKDGEERGGTALAITQKIVGGADIFSGAEAGSWSIWELIAAEGPLDRRGEAAAVALHMAESLRFDPTWLQTQLEITAAQSQIIADMSNDIAETMSEGYWGQQATYDAIFERRSDATLEVEDFTDPVTGENYQLDSSPNYYWIDHEGNIVGTDTSTLPGIDFRPLFQEG